MYGFSGQVMPSMKGMQGMEGMQGMTGYDFGMLGNGFLQGMGNPQLMKMQNFNIGADYINPMTGLNIGANENWVQGYTPRHVENRNLSNSQGPSNTINCVFASTDGKKFNIRIAPGKTIKELIKIFFIRVEKPELFDRKQDIYFLYNAEKMNIESQEKVENFFNFNINPRITVNDIRELIGA